jgi:MFS family permease
MPAKITNQYVLTALACVGGFLFGFDISSLSVILALPVFNQYFGDISEGGSRKVSSSLQGGISASMPGGSLLGALVSGTIADMLGRKKAIFVGCIIWLIGSILASASQNVPMLIVAR